MIFDYVGITINPFLLTESPAITRQPGTDVFWL